MVKDYDFAGWATKVNLRCSDGRTIAKGAFKECDGSKVPLVWNHNHSIPQAVLGHALLKDESEGTRAYCFFNDTESGQDAKKMVQHGDIVSLSIYANNLVEEPKNFVRHGVIREVSLVLAGANPGAFIDHSFENSEGQLEEFEDRARIYADEPIELYHADDKKEEDKPVAEEPKKPEDKGGEKTVQDVFNTLNEEQKTAVYAVIGAALEDAKKGGSDDDDADDNKEDKPVKHNMFDNDTNDSRNYLSHADGMEILEMAKANGGNSLRSAMLAFADMNGKDLGIAHADGDNDLGVKSIDQLFPEYANRKEGAPETLTTDQGWITKVLAKTAKSPKSRLRVRFMDDRDITGRRAQGYTKGTEKQFMGNRKLLKRTVDPTTVYNLDKLNRDDKLDITDFDIVDYMYASQRQNLNEELARQIMIGDGRNGDASDDGQKIDETKIIPIWGDDELFTIHSLIDVAGMRTSMNGGNSSLNFGDNYVYSEAVIQSLLYARENYKGSGAPDFYCTPHLVNVMLLARDLNGRRIYDNVNELRAAMNVNELITAEQFEGKTRTVTVNGVEQTRRLLGILVNLKDYVVGCTKGGEITHFTDFDLRFNQDLSLLETRCCGMLERPYSAIVLEEIVNP